MKNILITGGAGFIGSNLAVYLKKNNFNIYILDDLSVGKKNNLEGLKVKLIKKNINQINRIKFGVNFFAVIHLAALAEILIPPHKEKKYYESNVSGLQEVLNFSVINKVKKFIFASSASVYGDTKSKRVNEKFQLEPNHFYAYTKFIGEKMIENYLRINKINYTILRFFNVYGVKSNAVVAKFIAQKIQKKKITIFGNGKQKRDFIHVDDLNNVIKLILNSKLKNQIFNVGSGKAESIINLKKIISKEDDHIFLNKRNDDIEISISNITKVKKKLGWKPKRKFDESVLEIEKYDKNRLKKINLPTIIDQIKLIKKFNNKLKK